MRSTAPAASGAASSGRSISTVVMTAAASADIVASLRVTAPKAPRRRSAVQLTTTANAVESSRRRAALGSTLQSANATFSRATSILPLDALNVVSKRAARLIEALICVLKRWIAIPAAAKQITTTSSA